MNIHKRFLIILVIILTLISQVYALNEDYSFDNLFENHGSVMFIIDVESGKIIDANNAAVEFYGYSRDMLLSMTIQQINTLNPIEVENERKAAAKEERNYFNFRHRLANGEIKDVEVYSYPFLKDDRKLLYSIIHDITLKVKLQEDLNNRNRLFYILLIIFILVQAIGIVTLHTMLKKNKKIQVELLKSREQYKSLFDNMEEGFALHEIICDDNGNPLDYRFLNVNASFEKITKLKYKDIKDKTVLEVLPNTEKHWIETYGMVALYGESIHYENYSKELEKYFSVKVYKVEDKKFVTIFQDITEQVLSKEALEKERNLFKTTLMSVGDGVISTDKKGNVELMNSIAERLTGWTQKEAVGRPFNEIFNIINEITREKCISPVNEVLTTGKTIELEANTLLVSKYGTENPIEDSASPIIDEKGEMSGAVLVFRDYTDKREKQQRIEYLSFHDQLTGLYNRRFFEEELNRLNTERNLPLSIIMADVNGLKLTNDAFGHMVGDELLRKAAETIKSECREDDIIARIGGDEFVILLPKSEEVEAEAVVKRIKNALSTKKVNSIDISISFGWATKRVIEDDTNEVFKKAEDFMYARKLIESPALKSKLIESIVDTLSENKVEKGHSENSCKICKKITDVFEFDEGERLKFEKACKYHDIGKIAISSNIINKEDKLTNDEWKEIRRHPEIGYRILSSVNDLSEIAEYVLSHHERWDGKGYPRGLKGEEIPKASRLIALADAYETMISDRPYRSAMTKDAAIEEIRKNAGTQFDPTLAKIFVEKVLGSTLE